MKYIKLNARPISPKEHFFQEIPPTGIEAIRSIRSTWNRSYEVAVFA